MRFASLFAGVGGFDLGFERAAMTCAGQVEIDPNCRQVLAKHWPNVPQYGDIHEVSGLDDLGSVDVLVGGFPCQDYSVAGLRGGLAGDRGALWWQFHRLIAECRPQWVVGENVPGLLSSNGGRDFGAIVGSLVELGYGVVWRILDAQYFGVAQRRRRVLIVGHSGSIPRPEVLDLAQGCAWDPPPRREAGKAAAPTIGRRSTAGGGPGTDFDLNGGLIAATLETVPTSDRLRAELGHLIAYLPDTAGALRTRDYKGPPVDTEELPLISWSIRSLTELGNVSHTLRVSTAPGDNTPRVGVRRLTPLECERLQGFPDNWTAGQKDTQRYRQMGNAVAVPVAEWVGRRITGQR